MIKIIAAIYGILTNDVLITDIVGDRIFPNVIPDKDGSGETIRYPVIVMTRTSLESVTTKGIECSSDQATVEVLCYSESYFEVIDIAEKVRGAIEFFKGEVGSVTIDKTRLVSIDEGFTQNVFFQRLIFSFK